MKGGGAYEQKVPDLRTVDGRVDEDQKGLFCVRCAHRITSEAHRIERGGSHEHTRMNPAGVVFRFGCFSRADGCRVTGVPTTEHTWFWGFAWRFAHCARCQAHLGWQFTGEGEFFGLILDRLTEVC